MTARVLNAKEAPEAMPRGPRNIPLRVVDCVWGRYFEGTMTQLKARREIPAAWFDDQFVAGRRKKRFRLDDGRDVSMEHIGKYRYHVSIDWTEGEKRLQEIKDEREKADKDIAKWEKSADEFRKEQGQMIDWGLRLVDAALRRHGFRFDEETVDEIAIHGAAIQAAFAAGTVIFDPVARREMEATERAKALKDDEGFASFMGKLK